MLRFGLPTMPAELSLYALNVIDRIAIARLAGLAEAGLYALAFKFSQAIQVMIRGFQLAWPPLAYSIVDDDEARRAYAVIVTWFAVLASFAVSGLWLEARWIVRLLAAPEYFASYEAIGLLSAGSALYGFYLVLLVVLGRTGRTELNLPATAVAAVINIVLNILLIPPLGIVGAGIALLASYIVVLALMFRITQSLFFVPYEWGRLAAAVGLAAILTAGGELLLPTDGAVGLLARAAVWLAYLPLLWGLGFATGPERDRAAQMARAARGPGSQAFVVGLGRLAQARPRGRERLAGVEQVPAWIVARHDDGDQCPRQVGPGAQEPGDQRRRRAVVLSHVAVAAAVELDHSRRRPRSGRWRAARGGRRAPRARRAWPGPHRPSRLQKSVSSE